MLHNQGRAVHGDILREVAKIAEAAERGWGVYGWDVRELTRVIDKMPMRQREIRERALASE